jgi:cation diffusion facilitator CzcD-associated flavoprotein CzcO
VELFVNNPILRYVGAEEIWDFYRQKAAEYGLYDHAKFSHRVVRAEWEEADGRWTVEVEDLISGKITKDSAEVVINCAGVLKYVSFIRFHRTSLRQLTTVIKTPSRWKWPDIQGLHSFEGTLVHTGHYPQDLDLSGKRVAVIGAGSSAIQVVPTIQPSV